MCGSRDFSVCAFDETYLEIMYFCRIDYLGLDNPNWIARDQQLPKKDQSEIWCMCVCVSEDICDFIHQNALVVYGMLRFVLFGLTVLNLPEFCFFFWWFKSNSYVCVCLDN